jgi:hypothetical protein
MILKGNKIIVIIDGKDIPVINLDINFSWNPVEYCNADITYFLRDERGEIEQTSGEPHIKKERNLIVNNIEKDNNNIKITLTRS